MTKFEEIFDKLVKENTEASKSSEEMIFQNSISLEDMSFANVEPGKFSNDEITDADNATANLENPLKTDDNCEGEEPSQPSEEEPKDDEHKEDEVEVEILGMGPVTFESSFSKAFDKILAESDYIHRSYTPDARVNHNDVTLALRKEMEDNMVSVDSIDGNQSFKVSYVPEGKKLPKTLKVEEETFELGDDNIYTPKSADTETVLK